jgi:hypothetical protein
MTEPTTPATHAKPDAPVKDRGYTLPTAIWRSTYAECAARLRHAQSFAGASGFNGREMTAEFYVLALASQMAKEGGDRSPHSTNLFAE